MSELALQLIAENKRTKATFLDLGNCGLENELPVELFECVWLEGLNLSLFYIDNNRLPSRSKNKGGRNQLMGIQAIGINSLHCLKELYLMQSGIKYFSFLEKLSNLQTLGLNSNQITSVSFLEKLSNLQYLDLSYNQIGQMDERFLDNLPNLTMLNLQGNAISNVPPQIYNQDNCLTDLKNYFKDKKRESLPLYESKIILVGNGRVGKTCLVKRLLDKTFNLNEPTTHAIQLREWPLPELAEDAGLMKIQLNIWDFGGQDIYHATHRFFMRTQALFVLVWDVQTEQMPQQTEVVDGKKIIYKNYPMLYWLSYIKDQSNNSSVIVVQSKMGKTGKQEPKLSDEEKREYNVWKTVSVESSRNSANGFKELEGIVEAIVAEQVQKSCTEIPAQWYRVRKTIAEMQKKEVKQIPLAEFEQLCADEGLNGSSTNTLLKYLHNTGVFFYQEGIFNNQIVIDQKWAIDAVYTLFNRAGYFARIHNKGYFKEEDIQEAWKAYTPEEQELFISFMEQCEICFEINEQEARKNNFLFYEREFIAPQLLPEEKPVNEITYAFEESEGVYFKYQHRFLHAAVIQRFIVRTGFLSNINNMWKEGILIKTIDGTALIEAIPNVNELLIRIKGAHYENLLTKIRNELKEINQEEQDIKESVSLDGQTFVLLESLRDSLLHHNESVKAEDDTWGKIADYRMFLNPNEQIRFDVRKDKQALQAQKDNTPKIYFSYAWRDSTNEDREQFVDELYDGLKKDVNSQYKVIRDKVDPHYKGSIASFMKEIGKGDIVVVAISDKYLKSEYCMYELYELYRNSRLEKEELLKKIFPVRVEHINFNSTEVRKGYYEYWKKLEADTKVLVNEYGEDQAKHRMIEAIKNALRDLLLFLADINSLTTELLAEKDFAKMKEAIQQRIGEV